MHKTFLNDDGAVDEFIPNLALGLYISNSDAKILDANQTFLRLFHVSSVPELEKHDVSELLHLRPLIENLDLSGSERVIQEFELHMPDVDWVYNVLNIVRPTRDTRLGKILYQGLLLQINDRKVLDAPAPAKTLRDTLTGCFSELYLSEYETGLEEKSCGCVVAYLDHFKQYKDRYGMGAALETTQKMSRFLMRHIRAEDGVVKLANDHFVVLLGGANPSGVQKVAKRLRSAALSQAPLPFSMGTSIRTGPEPLQDTIHRADRSLEPVRVFERPPKSARQK